jgi:beta-glucosidase
MNDALHFPPGFVWGTASSSHQVEGNNHNNQWWLFEQKPGAIFDGNRSGLAADWWAHAERDLDLMQQFGLTAHRMSLEWSRIEPEPGYFAEDALDRYRQILQGMRDRGIQPMVTFHHFTNPLWLERKGGWEHSEVIARFQHYVRHTVERLSDLCDMWLTINEPLVYVAQGWFRGIWPPEKQDPIGALKVLRHLLLAHGAAYQAIHAVQPQARVGVAMAVRNFHPSNPESRFDRFAGWIKRFIGQEIWFQGTQDGRLRLPLGLHEYHKPLERSADFIGINYYSRDFTRFTLNPLRLFGNEHYADGGEFSDSGQNGVYSQLAPEGLHHILQELAPIGLPIYITENGLPDRDDDQRPRWLLSHLHRVHDAIRDGSLVKGYYHWTFTDNYEWSEGWHLRFGLVDLDPVTQVRTPRPSASLYSTIARENGISRALTGQYAPELLPVLFP